MYITVRIDGVDDRIKLERCSDCCALVHSEEYFIHREWHMNLDAKLRELEFKTDFGDVQL